MVDLDAPSPSPTDLVFTGDMGLELAPGTLAARPHDMSADDWRAVRATVERHGLRVTGLHWLLSPYPGLSIFDPATHAETQAVLGGLIDGCAALGVCAQELLLS